MAGRFCKVALLLIAAAGVEQAQAIIIAGGSSGPSPANVSAPADDPGWGRVGRVGGGTGVYLGHGWVLTANHVASNFTGIAINGTTYAAQQSAASGVDTSLNFRLDSVTGPGKTDLRMFKIDVTPGSALDGLGAVTLPSAPPVLGDGVGVVGETGTVIGTGRAATATSPTTWYVDVTSQSPVDLDWYTSPQPGKDNIIVDGYLVAGDATRTKRWGQMLVDDLVLLDAEADLGDVIPGFTTVFQNVAGSAIGVNGDSGSPLFVKRGGDWELIGLAHLLLGYDDQPAGTAMLGTGNFFSDLSQFRGQIDPLIPEPATAALLATGLAMLAQRRRG